MYEMCCTTNINVDQELVKQMKMVVIYLLLIALTTLDA